MENKYHVSVVFELCKRPYGKPELTDSEVATRVRQFDQLGRNIIVTNDSSFVAKLTNRKEFAKSAGISQVCHLTFLVGHDTIVRINDPKYYFDSPEERDRCIDLLCRRYVKFMVFPRNGKLREGINGPLLDACIFADDFEERVISSSQIRNGNLSHTLPYCRAYEDDDNLK
jgi:hypothetical protein